MIRREEQDTIIKVIGGVFGGLLRRNGGWWCLIRDKVIERVFRVFSGGMEDGGV